MGSDLILLLTFCLAIDASAQLPAESPDGPEHIVVYLTLEEALEEVFEEADTVWAETRTAEREDLRALERRLGWRVVDSTYTIHRGVGGGKPMGFAIVSNEIGLYRPITFLTKIDEDRKVEAVHVMVYRESRGGEVRRQRFLRQYRGKGLKSSIRINRDIIGVTGATLSVRALNAGVKKALAVVDAAYPQRED